MRGLSIRFFTAVATVSLLLQPASAQEKVEVKEAKKEIERLVKLREEVKRLINENKELLKKIEEEREKLRREREEFEKRVKEVESERYKKLAQVFSKMDPELAGQKISAFSDPKEAAYILYNMKSRKAGEILNYVDPKVVDEIVRILTSIRGSSDGGKSSPKS
jgi:flagellar motility protein MotE (MotC chaperone)